MRTFTAVVGANYGDEGKGLMTDYFCSKTDPEKTLVVRFNGGAQAGHTVVMPDGRQHVFGHIGAGTFRGCRTYLSKDFIVNPIVFMKEYVELKGKGLLPEVLISSSAVVTTPYDVILNRVLESRRFARHGSCGLGINETVERSAFANVRLQFGDISNDGPGNGALRQRLKDIRNIWFPSRLTELEISPTDPLIEDFLSKPVDEAFAEALTEMSKVVSICRSLDNPFSGTEHVVFEGAQGLLLDQNRMDLFPHLTRSNTGIQNVIDIMNSPYLFHEDNHLDITYVTRSYLTRHGNGPLENEGPLEGVLEKTNSPNDWQGQFRFAPFNHDLINDSIIRDMKHARKLTGTSTGKLAITCLDQVPLLFREAKLPVKIEYLSKGRTAEDVKEYIQL